jgi:hypothetical protein
MDRFNFLGRTPRAETGQRYQFDDDEDSDRRQLSPRMQDADIEAQHSQRAPEMAERTNPSSRFMLPRWSRPTIPSFLSMTSTRNQQQQPRPSSSHYSGDSPDPDIDSPKTPRFPRLGVPNMPSTRLNLPHLTRTWTQGSNGPPSRPATAQRPDWTGRPLSPARTRFPVVAGVAEPVPAVPAEHVQRTRGQDGHRRLFSDPEEGQLAALAEDGRQRRRHRRGGSGSSRGEGSTEEGTSRRSRRHRRHRDRHGRERGPPPKHFLFCFPWIKSRRIRSQILRCFVSGLFLTLLLTVCKFCPAQPLPFSLPNRY